MSFPISNEFPLQIAGSTRLGDRNDWDRRVRADLAAELEGQFPGPAFSVVGAQRMLAIKGYRELTRMMEQEVGRKQGEEALRACAHAIRAYIHERPGLASATWLLPTGTDKGWSDAAEPVVGIVRKALAECGLCGQAAQHAMHWLRSLVRGYVVHEMTGSFTRSVNLDHGFELGVSMFLRGLSVLREQFATPDFPQIVPAG